MLENASSSHLEVQNFLEAVSGNAEQGGGVALTPQ